MKIRYAKNLITGAIDTQSGGVEGEQAFLVEMRSNMIGDGASGITPEDVEVGWMEQNALGTLQAAYEASLITPTIQWERDMASSDETLPRYAEDILDGMPDKSGVAQISMDRLQAKKDLRATKP
jgi:hypothetical protein